MKTYICGPMTGKRSLNHPAFNKMAKRLRKKGIEVVNPAELDDYKGEPWETCLRRDLEVIVREVDRFVVLPEYHDSRGARLELHVARKLGMEIIYPHQFDRWFASL